MGTHGGTTCSMSISSWPIGVTHLQAILDIFFPVRSMSKGARIKTPPAHDCDYAQRALAGTNRVTFGNGTIIR